LFLSENKKAGTEKVPVIAASSVLHSKKGYFTKRRRITTEQPMLRKNIRPPDRSRSCPWQKKAIGNPDKTKGPSSYRDSQWPEKKQKIQSGGL